MQIVQNTGFRIAKLVGILICSVGPYVLLHFTMQTGINSSVVLDLL